MEPLEEILKEITAFETQLSRRSFMGNSDHTSGGNQFGADTQRGVTDSSGRVFGTTNVYVADSSLFPTAPGVNPSWTIMALARHVATGILTRA